MQQGGHPHWHPPESVVKYWAPKIEIKYWVVKVDKVLGPRWDVCDYWRNSLVGIPAVGAVR